MADASTFRDSTQILLPPEEFVGIREEVEAEFTVTVLDGETVVRIIGSPVEIKALSDFLVRHGVSVP